MNTMGFGRLSRFLMLVFSITLVPTSVSFATGGFVVSGGGFVGDASNPWFFTRSAVGSSTVSYCIARADNFPVDEDTLNEIVQDAFRFWRVEMAAASQPDGSPIFLATETPVRRPCPPPSYDMTQSDVTIPFFFGHMTAELQWQFMSASLDPNDFVAVAIRTYYDSVRMQGRGFIYVSPDRGIIPDLDPHLDPHLVSHYWQGETGLNRLRLTLIHELGHVYGIPHMGLTVSDLMHVRFVENLLNKSTSVPEAPNKRVFSWASDQWSHIPVSPSNLACVLPGEHSDRLMYRVTKGRIELGLADESTMDRVRSVGHLVFQGQALTDFIPVVELYLPSDQAVFPEVSGSSTARVLPGPMIRRERRKAAFVPAAGGPETEFFLDIDPRSGLQMGATCGGKFLFPF